MRDDIEPLMPEAEVHGIGRLGVVTIRVSSAVTGGKGLVHIVVQIVCA